MKTHMFKAALASFFLLSACGQASTDSSSPEAAKATAESIGAKTSADLSKMNVSEIIDFVDGEAKDMTSLLKTVTDGPSAEAAVEDIRVAIPRFNAAITSLNDIDPDKMKVSFGNLRKMMNVAQSQIGLFEEVRRISLIPEARAVLEKEFDKIEITNN